jgi:hypothetical protein
MLDASLLPDDIDALKVMLLAHEAALQVSQTALQASEARVAHLSAELSTRTVEIEHLKLVLAKLKRMQFGRRSEKLDQQIEQLELKLEGLEAEEAVAEAKAPVDVAPRKKAERKPLPADLLREERVLRPALDACPDCNGKLAPWAKMCRNSWSLCRPVSASSATCVPSWYVPAATASYRPRRPAGLSSGDYPDLGCWPMCW